MKSPNSRLETLLFGVMDPKTGGFREHSLVLGAALAKNHNVVVVSDKLYPLSAAEQNFATAAGLTFADLNDSILQERKPGIRIYQLANNPAHGFILREFMRVAGILILHDISLYWLLSGTAYVNGEFLQSELGRIGAELGVKALDWERAPIAAGVMAHSRFFNRLVCDRAVAVITHSAAMKRQLEQKFPRVPVHHLRLICNSVVPLDFLSADSIRKIRKRNGVPPDAVVFGVFGYATEHKRVRELLHAFSILAEDARHPANFHVLCAGNWDPFLLHLVRYEIALLRRKRRLTLIDRRLTRKDMFALMQATDVVANLRYPTAGESSGVTAECNALGVPVLFNSYAAFADLDNGFNVGLRVNFEQRELVSLISAMCNKMPRYQSLAAPAQLREQYDASIQRYGVDVATIVQTAAADYPARFDKLQFLRYFEGERRSHSPFRRVPHEKCIGTRQLYMFGTDQCYLVEHKPFFSSTFFVRRIVEHMEPRTANRRMAVSKRLFEAFNEFYPGMRSMTLAEACKAAENSGDSWMITDAFILSGSLKAGTLLAALTDIVPSLPIGGRLLMTENQSLSLVQLSREPLGGRNIAEATMLECLLRDWGPTEIVPMALGLRVDQEEILAHERLVVYCKETSTINTEFFIRPELSPNSDGL